MCRWARFAAIACFAIVVGQTNGDDKNKKDLSAGAFVDKASTDARTEIAAGQIALARSQNDGVKKFAARMVKDHTQGNNELLLIVSAKRIPIPENLTSEQQKMLMQFRRDSAKDFDKDYMKHMVQAHEGAVQLFARASKELKNDKLKAYAHKLLPLLNEHLALARKVNDELK